jgi:hypothetical protein
MGSLVPVSISPSRQWSHGAGALLRIRFKRTGSHRTEFNGKHLDQPGKSEFLILSVTWYTFWLATAGQPMVPGFFLSLDIG